MLLKAELYFNFFKCFTESDQRFLSQLKPLIVTYYSLYKAIQYQGDLKIEKRSNLEFKKNQASSARNRKNRNNLNSKTKNPASQNQNTLNFGENTCKQLNIVSCFQAWWPVPGSRYRQREKEEGKVGRGKREREFLRCPRSLFARLD